MSTRLRSQVAFVSGCFFIELFVLVRFVSTRCLLIVCRGFNGCVDECAEDHSTLSVAALGMEDRTPILHFPPTPIDYTHSRNGAEAINPCVQQ